MRRTVNLVYSSDNSNSNDEDNSQSDDSTYEQSTQEHVQNNINSENVIDTPAIAFDVTFGEIEDITDEEVRYAADGEASNAVNIENDEKYDETDPEVQVYNEIERNEISDGENMADDQISGEVEEIVDGQSGNEEEEIAYGDETEESAGETEEEVLESGLKYNSSWENNRELPFHVARYRVRSINDKKSSLL